MLDSFPSALAAAVALAGAVITAFWKYEDVASVGVKNWTRDWLNAEERSFGIAKQIVTMFDTIFGSEHLSIKCVYRCGIASVVALVGMTALWVVLGTPSQMQQRTQDLLDLGPMLIAIVTLTNIIPDYLSYGKARYLIRMMARKNKITSILMLGIADTILGIAVFYTSCAIAYVVMAPYYYNDFSSSAIVIFVQLTIHSIDPVDLVLMGNYSSALSACFYASMLVSLWSWLYALAATLTRLAARFLPFLTRWFDIDEHPIKSFGCIAGGICGFGFIIIREVTYF
jgi:hypothetical protein